MRTRNRWMNWDTIDYCEIVGRMRSSCASQFTIPITAGTGPDSAGNTTNSKTSTLDLSCRTPAASYLLVFSIMSLSPSPMSLSRPKLYHHYKNTMLSHPALSLHAIIMSWHLVQHTPSVAYTELSIHRVQHPPKIACDSLIFKNMTLILPMMQDYKLLTLCWHSVSRWGREGINICCSFKGGQ